MKRDPFVQQRLFCPGPTPIPEKVMTASLDATSIYHRSDEFYKIFSNCTRVLASVFGSKNMPLILTASGSGAMEAAVVNLTDRDDEVVTINGGKFGDRWQKLCEVYECNVHSVEVSWGDSPSYKEIKTALSKCKKPKALFLQANETSTGVHYPYWEWIKEAKKDFPQTLFVVDAISAIGAHPMKLDEWGIDCAVAGSQKGFGIPPGLSFVALSDRAIKNLSDRPRFYFDLRKELDGQKNGKSAYTPAISLVLSLEKALSLIEETGMDEVNAHHNKLAEATRAAVAALNLELLATKHPSNALTAVKLPDNVDGIELLKQAREKYGVIFAGGQGHLKGKIVRIAHLGFVDSFHLVQGLSALEHVLQETEHKFEMGAGLKAAQQRLAKDA